PTPPPRTPCAILLPRISSPAAVTCARSRSCLATRRFPPLRSIPQSTPSACSRSTAAPIPALDQICARDEIVTAAEAVPPPSCVVGPDQYIVTASVAVQKLATKAARACEIPNRSTSDQGEQS